MIVLPCSLFMFQMSFNDVTNQCLLIDHASWSHLETSLSLWPFISSGVSLNPFEASAWKSKSCSPAFSDHFKRELISVLDPFLRNKAEVAIPRRDVIEDYLMKLISILNMKLYLNLIQRILSIGWTHPLLYNTITVRRSATWPPCTFCCCYLWFSVVPIAAVHPAKDPPHLIDPGFFKVAFTRRSAQNRLMFS